MTQESKISYQTEVTVSLQSGLLVLCLGSALSQRRPSEMRDVVLAHDLAVVSHMESTWRHESQVVWLQLIRMALERLIATGKLTEEKAQEILSDYDQVLEDAEKASEEKQIEAVEQLQSSGLSGDAMERGLERAYLEHLHRVDAAREDALDTHIVTPLKGIVSANEVELICGELIGHVAKLETDIGDRIKLELNLLYEWLTERQLKIELHVLFDEQETADVEKRLEEFNKTVNRLISESKLGSEHKLKLLSELEESLKEALVGHQNTVFVEQNRMKDALILDREAVVKELEETHEAEAEDKVEDWCQAVSGRDMTIENFIKAYDQLIVKQTSAWFALHRDKDKSEKEKMLELRRALRRRFYEILSAKEEAAFQALAIAAGMSKKNHKNLLDAYRKNVDVFQGALAKDFAAKESEAAERIRAQHDEWNDLRVQLEKERWQLITLQQKSVHQVINLQIGMSSEVRDKLLHEHKFYTVRLASQLELSKLRQHKRLNQRLAQKKSRLVLLQLKHDEERKRPGNESTEIQAMLAKAQKDEYEDAKVQVEKEIEIANEELITTITEQAEEALKAQDKRLGILMGRLQVNRARKVSAAVQEEAVLERLQRRVLDSVAIPEEASQEIFGQHQRDVERIVRSRQESRDHQLMVMTEKLQSKKLRKKSRKVDGPNVRVGGERTTVMLTEILEDEDEQQAVARMEAKLKQELARKTAELNSEMESQLQQDINEIEKSFITHVAVEGKMTEAELDALVKKCYQAGGSASVSARTLSADLKERSRRLSTAREGPTTTTYV
ncbi:golgin subfamily A member 4-like [Oscarella lobularis]|uniref:golgin subfamily A member 4-like n=1 Tax=Oscarella lobularis TaxID=121494 RepID=UPI0033139EC0